MQEDDFLIPLRELTYDNVRNMFLLRFLRPLTWGDTFCDMLGDRPLSHVSFHRKVSMTPFPLTSTPPVASHSVGSVVHPAISSSNVSDDTWMRPEVGCGVVSDNLNAAY